MAGPGMRLMPLLFHGLLDKPSFSQLGRQGLLDAYAALIPMAEEYSTPWCTPTRPSCLGLD